MGLARTQEVLARLYTDAALREQFFSDPRKTGAALGLTPAETVELTALSPQQVRFFARSLHQKRLSAVRRLLPLTQRVLDERFTELFLNYADAERSQGPRKYQEDTTSFAAYLKEHVETHWIADLARYEAARQQIMNSTQRGVFVKSMKFDYAIHDLIRRLTRGEKMDQPPQPRRTLIFWFRFLRHGRPRQIAIPLALA